MTMGECIFECPNCLYRFATRPCIRSITFRSDQPIRRNSDESVTDRLVTIDVEFSSITITGHRCLVSP